MKPLILVMLITLQAFGIAGDYSGDGIVNFQDYAMAAAGGRINTRTISVCQEWLETNMASKTLQFDGSSGYVEFAHNAAFNFGTGSYSIAFVTGDLAGDGYVFAKEDTPNGVWINIQVKPATLALNIGQGAKDYWCHIARAIMPSGTKFFVYVYDAAADTFHAYINGAEVATTIIKTGSVPNADTTEVFTLGCDPTPYYFNGWLDDFRLYKSALTAAEVAEIYNSGIGRTYGPLSTGKTASFALNCDDSVTDAVNGLVGTIHGTVTYATGGTPIEPSGVNHYIIKRTPAGGSATIIGYALDPMGTVSLNEDISALADGVYEYTATPVSSYGVEGDPCDPLEITVASGAIVTMPAWDVNTLAVAAAAGGKFTVSWKYEVDANRTMPDKFYVYAKGPGDLDYVKIAEVSYTGTQGLYSHTTTETWTNGQDVYFKVTPVCGTTEKTTATAVHTTADTAGPNTTAAMTATAS